MLALNATTSLIDDFLSLVPTNLVQPNPLPAALGLALAIGNIMSVRNAELMHNSIADGQLFFVDAVRAITVRYLKPFHFAVCVI